MVAVSDEITPSHFPPLAVKAMGPFLKNYGKDQHQKEAENLVHQFHTMSRLSNLWQALPAQVKELIRPVEVYGVITDGEDNQFLFMEKVDGARKGMLTIYEGTGIDGGECRGFDVSHHPRLFELIKNELGKQGKNPLLATRVDSQGKPRIICSLTNLEEMLSGLGVDLREILGKDILWIDDEEGNRYYRIIDMRSHNFLKNDRR